jgi:hypothetical protein
VTRDRARKQAIRARMAASGEPYSVAALRLTAAAAETAAALDDLADVAACVARTLAAPSARVSSRLDLELPGTTEDDQRQARGLRGLVRRGLSTLFNPFLHSSHEGFAEPAAWRYQVAHRAHAELFADGRLYRGRPGRPLTSLSPDRPGDGEDVDHNLLWPLWALAGTIAASLDGTETVRDSTCQRYVVQADLDRAAAAGQPGVGDWPVRLVKDPPPQPPEFMVWTDGQHVRRVRFAKQAGNIIVPSLTGYGSLMQLDLWDFGVATAQLDWTRLPDFTQ